MTKIASIHKKWSSFVTMMCLCALPLTSFSQSNTDELKELITQLRLYKANAQEEKLQLQNNIQQLNSRLSEQFSQIKEQERIIAKQQQTIDSLNRRTQTLMDDLIRTSNSLDSKSKPQKRANSVVNFGSVTVSGNEDPKRTYSSDTRKIRATQGHLYHTGPRGGCYYLTASGRKQYVDRSLCN